MLRKLEIIIAKLIIIEMPIIKLATASEVLPLAPYKARAASSPSVPANFFKYLELPSLPNTVRTRSGVQNAVPRIVNSAET